MNPGRPSVSRVWSGASVVAEGATGDHLADTLRQHRDASAWWVVSRTDDAQLRALIEAFGLDQASAADLTSHDRRVRYEEVDGVRLLTTRAAHAEQERLQTASVSLLLSSQLLVVFADDRTGELISRRLTDAQERLATGGAERAAQAVLHGLISGYAEVVDQIESSNDDLADAMFAERPLTRSEKLQAFRLRRMVTELRRITEPMREEVDSLAQSGTEDPDGTSRGWSLVISHQNRVASSADALRDALGMLFDTSLSLDNARMDEVMKKLTGWAAIIAAPTLITGFAGMNVPFWLDDSPIGFYLYLLIMVGAVGVLFVIFKRKSWI